MTSPCFTLGDCGCGSPVANFLVFCQHAHYGRRGLLDVWDEDLGEFTRWRTGIAKVDSEALIDGVQKSWMGRWRVVYSRWVDEISQYYEESGDLPGWYEIPQTGWLVEETLLNTQTQHRTRISYYDRDPGASGAVLMSRQTVDISLSEPVSWVDFCEDCRRLYQHLTLDEAREIVRAARLTGQGVNHLTVRYTVTGGIAVDVESFGLPFFNGFNLSTYYRTWNPRIPHYQSIVEDEWGTSQRYFLDEPRVAFNGVKVCRQIASVSRKHHTLFSPLDGLDNVVTGPTVCTNVGPEQGSDYYIEVDPVAPGDLVFEEDATCP